MKIKPKWRQSGNLEYVARWRHVRLIATTSTPSWVAVVKRRWWGMAFVGLDHEIVGPTRKTPELAQRDAEARVPVLLCNLRDATARLLRSAGIDPKPQAPDSKDK